MDGGEERKEGEEDELNRDISIEETLEAMRRMKNGKAVGEDGIVNEIFKGGDMIKGWDGARIFPIFKEGEEGEVKNYRGVALLDVGYKVLAKILAARLGKWMEEKGKIGESQAGFRKARGTRDHIFVLNSLIGNKLKRKKGKLYVGFVDFRTAFDSVNREVMVKKLEKIGVRGRFLGMIERIYRVTENEVITEEGITERFRTEKGVRQARLHMENRVGEEQVGHRDDGKGRPVSSGDCRNEEIRSVGNRCPRKWGEGVKKRLKEWEMGEG